MGRRARCASSLKVREPKSSEALRSAVGFAFLDDYAPFHWLLSVDEPEICLPLLSPALLVADVVAVRNPKREDPDEG